MRTVVVQMWAGPRIIRRLGPGDPDPTPQQLDVIPANYTARNHGVRPVARVLEHSTAPSRSDLIGPAGSIPR